jgi:hypothetical protein
MKSMDCHTEDTKNEGEENIKPMCEEQKHCFDTEFKEFTDKAISQNVRLLGCVCNAYKNCDHRCCSTRLVASTKKPLEREKGHNAVYDIAALNITSKNDQASARTSQPH